MQKKKSFFETVENYIEITEKSNNLSAALITYYMISTILTLFIYVFSLNHAVLYVNIAILIGSLILYLHTRRKTIDEEFWSKRKMSIIAFFIALILIVSMDIIPTILMKIINNLKGTPDAIVSGTVASVGTEIDTIICAVIIGPIIEELMFRGLALRAFNKKDNKVEAIIFTSVVFGLMHSNFSQFISATIAGCIFGYVAIEYGLIYSILLHMLGNGMCYVSHFLDIGGAIDIFSIVTLLIVLVNIKYVIGYLKYNLKSETAFNMKRMLKWFLHITVLLYSIVWIICIIIDLVK